MKTKTRVISGAVAAGGITALVVSLIQQPNPGKEIALPLFRFAPGIIQSNYTWSIIGSTNLRDWAVLNITVDTNWVYWNTNTAPYCFYRVKGVPK